MTCSTKSLPHLFQKLSSILKPEMIGLPIYHLSICIDVNIIAMQPFFISPFIFYSLLVSSFHIPGKPLTWYTTWIYCGSWWLYPSWYIFMLIVFCDKRLFRVSNHTSCDQMNRVCRVIPYCHPWLEVWESGLLFHI